MKQSPMMIDQNNGDASVGVTKYAANASVTIMSLGHYTTQR